MNHILAGSPGVTQALKLPAMIHHVCESGEKIMKSRQQNETHVSSRDCHMKLIRMFVHSVFHSYYIDKSNARNEHLRFVIWPAPTKSRRLSVGADVYCRY